MEHHVHDVGRILLGAQAELRDIRNSISRISPSTNGSGEQSSRKPDSVLRIERAIVKAENHLKAKADAVLSLTLDQSTSVLPLIHKPRPQVEVSNLNDDGQRNHNNSSPPPPTFPDKTEKITKKQLSRTCHRSLLAKRQTGKKCRVLDQVRQAQKASMLRNPHKQGARHFIAGMYGLDIDSKPVSRSKPANHQQGKLLKPTGQDVQNQHPDAQVEQQGVLTLMNKGILPSHVDLSEVLVSGSRPALHQEAIQLHQWQSKEQKARPNIPNEAGSTSLTLKLDTTNYRDTYYPSRRGDNHNNKVGSPFSQSSLQDDKRDPHSPSQVLSPTQPCLDVIHPRRSSPKQNATVGDDQLENSHELHSAVNTIRGYNELLDTYSLHRFIIRNGKTLVDTPEFQSFKRKNLHIWGALRHHIQHLEQLFMTYSIPVAYVDGHKLVALAMDELSKHSDEDFVNCLANAAEVSAICATFGRKYIQQGQEQLESAATVIQSACRRYIVRCVFLKQRLMFRCACDIQHVWRGHRDFTTAQQMIKKHRVKRDSQSQTLQQWLCDSWQTVKSNRRVVVHVPSISLEEHVRLDTAQIAQMENSQMARLCDIADHNVDVIYVSPYLLTDEIVSYYEKLLSIGGVEEPKSRFKVVVPENATRFPEHFALSTILYYSPRALRRISRLIQGQTAYIVPGIVGPDDQNVSLALNIPILGPSPQVTSFYNSVSGAKTIFREAGVNIPPMLREVYEMSELLTGLSKLIATNLHINRWVLRSDDDYYGRGTAYCDVDTMFCITELRKEKAKISSTNASYWNRPDVQEASQARVLDGLEREFTRRLRICYPGLYADGVTEFLEAFCRVGGVVEADTKGLLTDADGKGHPDLMNPSVNLFIEPNGTVFVTSTHDRIYSSELVCAGNSFPQKSVPQRAIIGAAQSIGSTLRRYKVYGHVCLDFCALYESSTSGLKMWANGLHIGMTNSAVSFAMFHFLADGNLDPDTGQYTVEADDETSLLKPVSSQHSNNNNAPTIRQTIKKEIADIESGNKEAESTFTTDSPRSQPSAVTTVVQDTEAPMNVRCFVSFENIFHSGFNILRYGSFFSGCRRRNIAFDLQNQTGLAFMLIDSFTGGTVGTLSVGYTYYHAIETLFDALSYIREEVGLYSTSQSNGSVSKPRISGEDPSGNNFAEIYKKVRSLKQAEHSRVQKVLKARRRK